MTAQFPALRGPSGADFPFDLELTNDTNQETTFSLEAVAPRGWQAEARPTGEEQAATAVVAAGESTRIQVEVSAPAEVPAGEYPVLVRAIGGPQPVETELTVEITGSFSMTLDTADQRLNARVTVGGSSTVTLVVTNDGSAPLTDVQLSATPPQGWEYSFEPQTIPELPAGERQTVTMTLQAASNAIAGDYQLTVTASSPDADDQIELRATVEASPVGGVLGLALLGAVVVGLFVVFRRYGRR